tara:strand:- start:125 stop:952 length:828 start_codon:yes stop_codon:yes gene_type:complete
MKNIYLLFAFISCLFGNANAQCSPDITYTMLGIPGVYPPELPIPGVPMVGMTDGVIGNTYSQALTLVVLEDTTMDIASFLPTAASAAMNLAGISTVMSLDVNHVTFAVSGLPNGLSYTCDQNNCEYLAGVDGCISVSGTPTQGGIFAIPVNMIINAQIPPITDPILGTVLFAGMAVDFPSFTAVEYDLFIDGGATAISEVIQHNSLYPNPTANEAKLLLLSISDVLVYNILGKEVLKKIHFKGELILSKNDLGKGMFYVMLQSENKSETIKLIIK